LREIHGRTGVSRATLSVLLREHPLTDEELLARRAARVPHRGRYKELGSPSALYRLAPGVLTRATKARIAEAAVTLRLALWNFRVFHSAFEGDTVDCLVIPPGRRPAKLQVKWARPGKDGGLAAIRLMRSNGRGKLRRYTEGEFDFMVGYDLYSDTAFVWSWTELREYKGSVTICSDASERWDKLLGE
jgi:hypothetical protein